MSRPSDVVYFLSGVVAALLMVMLCFALGGRHKSPKERVSPVVQPPVHSAKIQTQVLQTHIVQPPIVQPPPPSCEWKFISYTPSPYEQFWTENIASLQWDVCNQSNRQLAEVTEWIEHSRQSNAPHTFPARIFSYHSFRNPCTGETLVDFIEPLAGLTRSPLFCLNGDADVVSKEYLVVSWNASRKLLAGKAYYFDLGASLYHSGSGGSSQDWFVETYERRGIKWDGIFAWEVAPHDPAVVWGSIPAHLRPIYHWYNIPTHADPAHPDNALNYIVRVATPEDFVVLKLDIDNTEIEEALVNQILSSERLRGLIDELFFEHHVNTPPMHRYWHTAASPRMLTDTYRIFSALRHGGILAHSWV